MPDHLQQIAAAPTKAKQMSAQRIAPQHLLHQQRQTRKALPHIGVTGRQPYPHAARKRDHARSSTARTRASAAESTPLSTTTRRPHANTISIRPATPTGACGKFSVPFNAFGERWRTGRRSLPADNRRRECGSLFGLNKPPCSGQPAPGEQLARRQPIPPRRRRHNPRRAVALRHDPLLLSQRPAPAGTCRNNLEPRDLRNSRMVSHTPMSSPSGRITQGGARRSDTKRLA